MPERWEDPTRVSLRQLDRHLKRRERSLFNCINSILHDVCFVDEIRSLYPSLPALANLRCGLWWVAQQGRTCHSISKIAKPSTSAQTVAAADCAQLTRKMRLQVCQGPSRHMLLQVYGWAQQ